MEGRRGGNAGYRPRNDSRIAALLSFRNVIGLPTKSSSTTNLNGHYLTKATSVDPWIIGKGTTSERSRKWGTGYSSGDDAEVATLLGLRDIVGLPTRQSGTRDVDGNYLIRATSVGLRIVVIATTQGWCRGWMAWNTLGNNSTTAALLGMRNVKDLSTWQSGTTNLEGNYLAKATSMGLGIIREGTTSERSRKWSAWYSSGNDTRMATLLGLRNIVGLSTRQSGTRHLDGHYLTKATSVSLPIVGKATTLRWCRRWIAWNTLGNHSTVTALVSMRHVDDLFTTQPRAGNFDWKYLIKATFLALWIIRQPTAWLRHWYTLRSLGNYTAIAALLVVGNVRGFCTAQSGTLDSHWNYLIVATLLTFTTVEGLTATRTLETQS